MKTKKVIQLIEEEDKEYTKEIVEVWRVGISLKGVGKMKDEQVYYKEHTPTKGEKCRLEIKLFKKSVLTIFQSFIDGKTSVVVLHGEGLQALKKMLEGVK